MGIKGNDSFRVIDRGATLVATGTSTNPIIFTNDQAPGSRAPGDWGGVMLLGEAPNNQSNALNITIASTAYTGGGSSTASNSGSLQFVQVNFAGAGGGAGSDRLSESALILNSVGNLTVVDHVQINNSDKDGIGVWGGTAELKHVFNHAVRRTDFMMSFGYQGNAQFLAGFKHDATANTTNVFSFAVDVSNDIFRKAGYNKFDVPEFLVFDGTRLRTQRLNSAITLIYQNDSKLQGKKMGQVYLF